MVFLGAAHPQPSPKNICKNLGTFFLIPTLYCLLGRGAPPRAEKKKRSGGGAFQLDFLRVGGSRR